MARAKRVYRLDVMHRNDPVHHFQPPLSGIEYGTLSRISLDGLPYAIVVTAIQKDPSGSWTSSGRALALLFDVSKRDETMETDVKLAFENQGYTLVVPQEKPKGHLFEGTIHRIPDHLFRY